MTSYEDLSDEIGEQPIFALVLAAPSEMVQPLELFYGGRADTALDEDYFRDLWSALEPPSNLVPLDYNQTYPCEAWFVPVDGTYQVVVGLTEPESDVAIELSLDVETRPSPLDWDVSEGEAGLEAAVIEAEGEGVADGHPECT